MHVDVGADALGAEQPDSPVDFRQVRLDGGLVVGVAESEAAGEKVFKFDRAEDRFAVGVIQAMAYNPTERDLHAWITQLLNALNSASKATEDVASAYHLKLESANSVIGESQKIPAAAERADFLFNCWLETLCTAEIRVLGWLYREIYGRPFHPTTF